MSCGRIGFDHSAVLDSTGAIWTVGCGEEGQLGHGDLQSSSVLQQVRGLPPCTIVSAGYRFTACVSHDGEVFCFGRNVEGQLGQGHTDNLATPGRLKGLPPIRFLQCGHAFVVCVGEDDSVWVFGANDCGQLGVGHHQSVKTPCRMPGMRVRQVACGIDHTLMVTTTGALYACGDNTHGQLGLGGDPHAMMRTPALSHTASPTPVALPIEVASVHCGHGFSIIRAMDGTVWAAGHNEESQLGLMASASCAHFTPIPDLVVTQVVCGYKHVVAVDRENRMWGWGWSGYRQLSNPLDWIAIRSSILRDDVRLVLAGAYHTVALTVHNHVEACGANDWGQLATGDTSHSPWTPSLITADMMNLLPLEGHQPSCRIEDWHAFQTCMPFTPEEERKMRDIDASSHQAQELLSIHSIDRVPTAPYSIGSWDEAARDMQKQVKAFTQGMVPIQAHHATQQANIRHSDQTIAHLQDQLAQEQAKRQLLVEKEQELAAQLVQEADRLRALRALAARCRSMALEETQHHKALQELLNEQGLRTLQAEEMELVWWRAGLNGSRAAELQALGITGDMALTMQPTEWTQAGLDSQEICRLQFTLSMLDRPGGVDVLCHLPEEDCVACNSCDVRTTLHLLQERGIKVKTELVEERAWIVPHLIYAPLTPDDCDVDSRGDYFHLIRAIMDIHASHLDHLSQIGVD